MSGKAQQQSRIKELITLGREQKYLTYAEVNDHLPEDISDPEQVEDIIRMINDMGIPVHESAPDADALMLADADTDEAAAEEAAAALAAVEKILLIEQVDHVKTQQHFLTMPRKWNRMGDGGIVNSIRVLM